MGIGVSIFLIAVGAILAFAVHASTQGVDLNTVGVILMVVGLIGALMSAIFWSSWGGFTGRRVYADDYAPPERVVTGQPAREDRVVRHEYPNGYVREDRVTSGQSRGDGYVRDDGVVDDRPYPR